MSPVSPWRTFPGVWQKVSQIEDAAAVLVGRALDLVGGRGRSPRNPGGKDKAPSVLHPIVISSSLTQPRWPG